MVVYIIMIYYMILKYLIMLIVLILVFRAYQLSMVLHYLIVTVPTFFKCSHPLIELLQCVSIFGVYLGFVMVL